MHVHDIRQNQAVLVVNLDEAITIANALAYHRRRQAARTDKTLKRSARHMEAILEGTIAGLRALKQWAL